MSKSTLKLGERDLKVEGRADRVLDLGEPPRLREKSSRDEEEVAVSLVMVTVASWTFPSELEQLEEARETFSGEQDALKLLAMGWALSKGKVSWARAFSFL